jgi:hypothetical protein
VECGAKTDRIKPAKDVGVDELCPRCKMPMVRDYAAERHNIQGGKEYHRPIHSDSLAINPNQREQHEKMFPDVPIDSEGRPVFTSFKQHDNYLKATGFVKNPQRIKKHGKRIA